VRPNTPFEHTQHQHEDSGDAVLDTFGADFRQWDGAEGPSPLVGSRAQIKERRQGYEAERPMARDTRPCHRATQREEAHAEQDEPGDVVAIVQGFMTAFPDLKVYMEDLVEKQGKVIYKWPLEGTNSGPGGTGRRVRISDSKSGGLVMMAWSPIHSATSTLRSCGVMPNNQFGCNRE
jgi:SnoaL-like polyketide cyclase